MIGKILYLAMFAGYAISHIFYLLFFYNAPRLTGEIVRAYEGAIILSKLMPEPTGSFCI